MVKNEEKRIKLVIGLCLATEIISSFMPRKNTFNSDILYKNYSNTDYKNKNYFLDWSATMEYVTNTQESGVLYLNILRKEDNCYALQSVTHPEIVVILKCDENNKVTSKIIVGTDKIKSFAVKLFEPLNIIFPVNSDELIMDKTNGNLASYEQIELYENENKKVLKK